MHWLIICAFMIMSVLQSAILGLSVVFCFAVKLKFIFQENLTQHEQVGDINDGENVVNMDAGNSKHILMTNEI